MTFGIQSIVTPYRLTSADRLTSAEGKLTEKSLFPSLNFRIFIKCLKGQFASTTREAIASSSKVAEKDMKTKHVKKKMPATSQSASTGTPKSVETL